MSPPGLEGTLLEWLARRASTEPCREAFVFSDQPTTYGELWRGIEEFAHHLAERGVAAGERVVIALPNGAPFFSAFYGAQRVGAIAVPVFPGSGVGRLTAIAGRCRARAVVTGEEAIGAAVAAAPELEGLGVRVVAPKAAGGGAPAARRPALDPEAVAYIQYTSGSSGEPKGVPITHAKALANVEQMAAGMAITEREVFVSWLPVHHDMGLVLMTMTPFRLGARLILLPANLTRVRAWLEAIERHRGTFTAAPDFAYRLALRRVDEGSRPDLSSLRVALNAAEPVRARTLADFESAFGLQRVMAPGYGLAEATVGVSMSPPGRAARFDPSGFAAVGRGFPRVELAILGHDRLAEAGETGEILVRSPANTGGYWGDPAASRELFWGDGFLRTGDLGYLDAEGELFVVGRCKNIIIQGGRNIAPSEVEGLVDALPFVRLSAAVGIDRGGVEGEQLYVFVELRRRQPAPAECRRMVIEATRTVREELGLGPARVYLMPPGSIPRTHNGKLRHAELTSLFRTGSLAAAGRLLFPSY